MALGFSHLVPVYVFGRVVFDFFFALKKRARAEEKRKASIPENLVALSFFIFYAFFLNSGVEAMSILVGEFVTPLQTSLISILFFSAGYELTKIIFYRGNKMRKKEEHFFLIFLHYFYFCSGAAVFLFLAMSLMTFCLN